MTETFSIGEAMATPGRVIRRHPLAVFVWGFVMMAYSLGGAALMFGTLANLPLGEGAEPPPEMLGQMIAFQGVSMLLNVGQMLLAVVIWAATMRATLMIGRLDRYFFMRIGIDELRLAVVALALFLGPYIVVFFLVLFWGGLSALLFLTNYLGPKPLLETVEGLLAVVLTITLIAAVAVAMARLSLIAPATIMLKRFAFVEGWTLGKRRTLPLLGLLVCTWLVYLVVYFVLAFVVIVALFASGVLADITAQSPPATLGELFPSPPVLATVAGLMLVPGGFVYGAVMTLLSAPFASACRQLLDGPSGAVFAAATSPTATSAGDAADTMV